MDQIFPTEIMARADGRRRFERGTPQCPPAVIAGGREACPCPNNLAEESLALRKLFRAVAKTETTKRRSPQRSFAQPTACLHVPAKLTLEPAKREARKRRANERHAVGCCEELGRGPWWAD